MTLDRIAGKFGECSKVGFFALFVLLNFIGCSNAVLGPTWWSSVAQLGAHSDYSDILLTSTKPLCSQLPGLSPGQARICELFMDHMAAVGQGARQAIEECQRQFKDRRWNCSTPYGSNIFGPVHILGVAHEVARQCRFGMLSACGCSESKRPKDLHPEWVWGGCGDNFDYGYQFSRGFIDIREREHDHPKDSAYFARSLVNRWNNEVGRKIIKRRTKVACKCHGVSGSCNLKTCWNQMPKMSDTGRFLAEKYDEAVRVRLNHRGNLQLVSSSGNSRRKSRKRKRKSAKQLDLVYLDESPDYCRRDFETGTLGTRGRLCNKTSKGMDSCELLCCGRGYNTFKEVIREKCNCRFQWCCKVVCKICVRKKALVEILRLIFFGISFASSSYAVQCSDNPCANDGHCNNINSSSVSCSCQPDYTGENCTKPVPGPWTPLAFEECTTACSALNSTPMVTGKHNPSNDPLYICSGMLNGYRGGYKRHGVPLCYNHNPDLNDAASRKFRCLCTGARMEWRHAGVEVTCSQVCEKPVFAGTHLYGATAYSENPFHICKGGTGSYKAVGYQLDQHTHGCAVQRLDRYQVKECLCHTGICHNSNLTLVEAYVVLDGWEYDGSHLTATCSPDYRLAEDVSATSRIVQCSNGIWSPASVTCKRVCENNKLGMPMNGSHNGSASGVSAIGTTVQISCNEDYVVPPEFQTIHCKDDGKWSSQVPHCKAPAYIWMTNQVKGRYTGTIMESAMVKSTKECMQMCLGHPRCFQFNMKGPEKPNLCELLDSELQDFEERSDYQYFGIEKEIFDPGGFEITV